MARLEASSLSYAYVTHTNVVHDVSLHVDAGEILFLLGHNGSGKSSLLGCLAGVLRPTAGNVVLDGVDLATLRPVSRARRVGLIPQVHVAGFAYEVFDVVLMGRAPHLSTFRTPRASDRRIAIEALERVGLDHLRERHYTELSGGERQLVLVARGLAQRCDVLLMDEPDAHLDPRNRHRVLEAVTELARSEGVSFVIASHSPNSALTFADRVLLLRDGRTLASGNVVETLTAPLLESAYDMPLDVVSEVVAGRRVPRAIVARRTRSAQPP